MSWDRILLDEACAGASLPERIDALFAQQRDTWPTFRDGEAALQQLRTKRLTDGDDWIVVQANPARRRSTHAKVDARSIASRACFLCPENMPPEERGVAFENLVILPNPYPILRLHCTVADREHQPQQLAGHVEQLLRLAQAVGPQLAVFYNGPQCGASAPDHLHYQACSAAEIPLLQQVTSSPEKSSGAAHFSFGRSVIVFIGGNAAGIQAGVERAVSKLAAMHINETETRPNAEPMVNLIAHASDDRLTVLLFPRKAHRPSHYFAEGSQCLAISPAALEMAGILVAAEVDDLDRIDAATARAIYQEVSTEPSVLARLI